MYSWKSLVDGRARLSLSRNEDAAAAQIRMHFVIVALLLAALRLARAGAHHPLLPVPVEATQARRC